MSASVEKKASIRARALILGALLLVMPARARADDPFARRVNRDQIERAVLARNPGLRASERRAGALRTAADAERRLPPPQAGVDVWQVPLSKPYDVAGAGMIMVALRQDFTPGRAARGEEKEREATLERTMTGERSRELLREAGHAFFDYVEASELHRIHVEHKASADRIVKLTQLRYAAGGDLMDSAQADVEAASIETEIVTEAENLVAARAKLNGLLLRGPDAALGPPDVPEPETPDESADALVARSRRSRSDVRVVEARRAAELARARADEREASTPTVSVGALYFAPTRDTPEHAYGVSVAATLPWLWGRGRTQARAARELARASEDDVLDNAARVRTEVSSANARARAAARRFETIRDRALPAAKRAEQAAGAGYDSGKTSALSLFVARRAVVEMDVELIRARAALGHALVDLDWAVGSRVRRRPLEAKSLEK